MEQESGVDQERRICFKDDRYFATSKDNSTLTLFDYCFRYGVHPHSVVLHSNDELVQIQLDP